jgi:UDP-galactopyranose mutase
MKRIVVVGAGLSGAVVARELAVWGLKVLVIEERNHLARGNDLCFLEHIDISDVRHL